MKYIEQETLNLRLIAMRENFSKRKLAVNDAASIIGTYGGRIEEIIGLGAIIRYPSLKIIDVYESGTPKIWSLKCRENSEVEDMIMGFAIVCLLCEEKAKFKCGVEYYYHDFQNGRLVFDGKATGYGNYDYDTRYLRMFQRAFLMPSVLFNESVAKYNQNGNTDICAIADEYGVKTSEVIGRAYDTMHFFDESYQLYFRDLNLEEDTKKLLKAFYPQYMSKK